MNNSVNSFYTIISGLFIYNEDSIDRNMLQRDYFPWQNRIFDGNYKDTFDYLKANYYNNYLNNIFPEINEPDRLKRKEYDLLDHCTFKDCIDNKQAYSDMELELYNKDSLLFNICHSDLYLFPHNIGIFSIKVELSDKNMTLENVSDFTNKIRLLGTAIKLNNAKESTVKQLVEDVFLQAISLEEDWAAYNPQLKSYIQLDLKEEQSDQQRNQLLYDLGNISPLGSAAGEGGLAPSKEYYQSQLLENRISVFNNWSALALFDTFTRLSSQFPDRFHSWEYDYFNVYIHALYSKFFMYITSSKLSDVTIVNKETSIIRDEFIEFINDELHSHVSYKFLPNLMIEKLHHSLGIETEVKQMEIKILRINEYLQEKRDKTLNIAISVIAVLSVFSSLYDFSEWGVANGYPKDWMFPYTSISISILVFAIIFIILRKNKNN